MNHIGSYVIYLISFGISLFWSWSYGKTKGTILRRKKIIYGILVTMPVIFIQGFRYDVGTDFLNYASIYANINKADKPFGNEVLFAVLCRFIHVISFGNTTAFFLINACLMNVIVFLTFDYYRKQASIVMMYLFYYMLCFPYFLNIEREGLAVVIVWFATRYIHEKKRNKFLICILVAALIHNTAIVGLVLYFILYIAEKYKKVLIFFLISLFWIDSIFVSYTSLLNNEIFSKYIKYLNLDVANNVGYKDLIFFLFMLTVLLLGVTVLKQSRINFCWLIYLCAFQVATYILAKEVSLSQRMSFYFEIGIIYAYGYMGKNLKIPANRIAFWSFSIFAVLFFFTYKFNIVGIGEIYPYQFVWQS